ETQGLAGAGRHDGQRIDAMQHVVDHGLLPRPQTPDAEFAAQQPGHAFGLDSGAGAAPPALPGRVHSRPNSNSRSSVTASDTRMEPRQPSRLEKKTNMSAPVQDNGSGRKR